MGSIKKNFSCYEKKETKRKEEKTKSWLPSSQLEWTHGIKSDDVLNLGETNVLHNEKDKDSKHRRGQRKTHTEGRKNLFF